MKQPAQLQVQKDISRKYRPSGKTLVKFHESNDFVRGIMGPIGSAKSSSCVMEILLRAHQQRPGPDGLRRTRWAIIRNTYPELRTTTVKTWGQWCPPIYGKLTFDSPITHRVITQDIDMEILFLALDKPDDMRKLLSLELTGAWINEAREVPKSVIDMVTGRVGRYPAKMDGGPTWHGVIMDTNPPDDQHWWYNFAENAVPEGWQFWKQPSGRSPEAENLANLPKNYYKNLAAGKDPDWIKVYVDGEYGYVVEGKPVYPMYLDSSHCAGEVLEPNRTVSLFVGVDFGVSSTAVIGQKLLDGQWIILDEFMVNDGMGIKYFGEQLLDYVNRNYPGFKVGGAWYDPSGENKTIEGGKPGQILEAATGWGFRPAPTNDIDMRLEAVKGALRRLVNGRVGLLVSPKAQKVRKGFTGGYHYKTINDGSRTLETPDKNEFSHYHDSIQYLLLGGGEISAVLNEEQRRQARSGREPRVAKTEYDVFGRR